MVNYYDNPGKEVAIELVEKRSKKVKFGFLLWLPVALALWWVLRNMPFDQIFATVARLQAWQVLFLIGVNSLVVLLFSLRWWLILRALGTKVSIRTAAAYHLVGFGVSYFTFGPQLGGEPLQVILLAKNLKVPTATALSSVFLDKVFEILTNFTFLVTSLCIIFLTSWSVIPPGSSLWLLAVILILLPVLHLLALRRGVYPATRFLQKTAGSRRFLRLQELVAQSEIQISRLLIEQPAILARLAFISGLSWIVMICEYSLVLIFVGVTFSLSQILTAFVASQVAFLTPLPGGLGALEVSQAYSFSNFGLSAAVGLSVAVIIRARDVFFGLIGLGIAGISSRKIMSFNQKTILHSE